MESKEFRRVIKDLSITFSICILSIFIGQMLHYGGVSESGVELVYLTNVVIVSILTQGYGYGIISSVLSMFAFSYFVIPPTESMVFSDTKPLWTVIFMVVFSIIISYLASKSKLDAAQSQLREKDATLLFEYSKKVADATSLIEIAEATVSSIGEALDCPCKFLIFDEKGNALERYLFLSNTGFRRMELTNIKRDFNEYWNKKPNKKGYYQYGSQDEWVVRAKDRVYGAVGIPDMFVQDFTSFDLNMIATIVDQAANYSERLRILKTQESNEEKIHQEQFRSNLLRSISHDLRTPLAGITGTSELLSNMLEPGSESQILAGNIHKESKRLHELVKNVLSLTRLQNGSVTLQMETQVVEDIIESAVEAMQLRAPDRVIETQYPDDILTAPMDARLIEQVVVNLLDNADKHTPKGGKITVRLRKDQSTDNILVDVMDEGLGISDEAMKQLFSMFYTTSAKAPDSLRGYGLGLPICNSIMQAHHGNLLAANRTDRRGAIFTVVLNPSPEAEKSTDAQA